MLISLLIIFASLFLVFMFSLENLEGSAKTVSVVIGIILIGYILYMSIRG